MTMMRALTVAFAVSLVALGAAAAEPTSGEHGFFFNVNIDLASDGSGTLQITYPSNPYMNIETERTRFLSPVTKMTQVEFNGLLVRTTVAFTDVTRLSEASELQSITAKREKLDDGRERLQAKLRSYLTGNAKTEQQLTITVNFPGAITEANTKEVAGAKGTWRPQAVDFFKEDGIVLEAVYRPGPSDPAATRPN